MNLTLSPQRAKMCAELKCEFAVKELPDGSQLLKHIHGLTQKEEIYTFHAKTRTPPEYRIDKAYTWIESLHAG